MYIGLFDMYKIGIGPSSSHTFGPMVAANKFIKILEDRDLDTKTNKILVKLYGSLSLTGKGHLTDIAIFLGLSGFKPHDVPSQKVEFLLNQKELDKEILLKDSHKISLRFEWIDKPLPLHENGLSFHCFSDDKVLLEKTYYSVGGGFVVENFSNTASQCSEKVPYSFLDGDTLLEHAKNNPLYDILLENELCFHTRDAIKKYVKTLWQVMREGVERGMQKQGKLPAPTSLERRGKNGHDKLKNSIKLPFMMAQMEWVSLFAIAMSEENASGSRVITAPTNGACGIIPAVLMYHHRFIKAFSTQSLMEFFLVSSAIGSLFKRNASISGAEVGCQGEVGVASSMAAAGLAQIMSASPRQVFIAAEIAMEHHLGLTCDPLNGQVQVPCIERNGIAAVTAINAVSMALCRSKASTKISFDTVVETMRQTGKDMDPKYRETSCGGLAVVALEPFTCKS